VIKRSKIFNNRRLEVWWRYCFIYFGDWTKVSKTNCELCFYFILEP